MLACRLECGAYAGVLALPGWPAADFVANEGKGAEAKLNAVLLRAEAIATGAQLKKSQGRSHALPDFEWASCGTVTQPTLPAICLNPSRAA